MNNSETERGTSRKQGLATNKNKMTETYNFTYFKVTFIAVAAGLTGGLITKGLFDVDFRNIAAIGNLILKSLIMGTIIGALLGILNIFFKIGPVPKPKGKTV